MAAKKTPVAKIVQNIVTDEAARKSAAEIRKTMARQQARATPDGKKQPGLGSWRNPRVRDDGKDVYSTTIHLPRELAKAIDRFRAEEKLRLNEIVNEALVSWLKAKGVKV